MAVKNPPSVALGLFHFNVQYVAGDIRSYHSYCTQAILPFLKAVARNTAWRVSFELSGSGLSFLADNYKPILNLLKELVGSGQVELISSTYTPVVWPAFPLSDLVKSIEHNRDLLGRLGLPASRIFFSQEAFFGVGLKNISPWFDIFLCKKEYLDYSIKGGCVRSKYRMGRGKVLVGDGHIINSLASTGPEGGIPHRYIKRINKAQLPSDREAAYREPIDAMWYHMGSGHHLSCPSSPNNVDNFLFEQGWLDLNVIYLNKLIGGGLKMVHISEYADSIKLNELPDMPYVPEGSWNTWRSKGIYVWMGQNLSAFSDNSHLLSLAWRSRRELRKCDSLVGLSSVSNEWREKLALLWGKQLLAESSDFHGWTPLQREVFYGRACIEDVLASARQLRIECELQNESPASMDDSDQNEVNCDPPVQVMLVGNGAHFWSTNCDGVYCCDYQSGAGDLEFGLSFEISGDRIAYCPTGLEDTFVDVVFSGMNNSVIYLPLANGLIGIGDRKFIIRHNHFGFTAVKVCRSTSTASFISIRMAAHVSHHWRFTLYEGEQDEAMKLANNINSI